MLASVAAAELGAVSLFASQLVIDDASEGDPDAAKRRLEVLKDIPLLALSEDVAELAQAIIEHVPFPERAAADALHIAIAVVNGMDYLCLLYTSTLPTICSV